MIILDTDVCLAILSGKRKTSDLSAVAGEEFCVTYITVRELFYAASKTQEELSNKILVEKFLLTLRVLHPDMETSRLIANYLHHANKKNQTISVDDLTTFCISKVYGARLITMQGKRYCFT
jgi:predicted nucleic acid-binding protein